MCAAESDGSTHGIFSLGDTYLGVGHEAFTLDCFMFGPTPSARLVHKINNAGVQVIVPILSLDSPMQYAANLTQDGNIGITLLGASGAVVTGSSL
jgi:hypothetical protein